MVKIKEGYVMNVRERAEYERVNALPRKKSGKVDYYFKPQTKYPPRIYVFMHAEIWCDRNRRPMGLFHALPFFSRPMNEEEIEYHHFDTRLCYHQYEDWDKLLYAERQEAEQLDKENPGMGTALINRLSALREKFPLKAKEREIPPVPPVIPVSEEMRYINELMEMGETLTASEISSLLDAEQHGEKHPMILALLRQYYQNIVLAPADRIAPDAENLQRKVLLSQERSRKNFVRRIYRRNPLFALEEIRTRYADYVEEQLTLDLQIKKKIAKPKKQKPVLDLRRCQLEKLAAELRHEDLPPVEYNTICNRIVLLQNAHDLRLAIPLTVKLQGETLVYDFNWKTRERVVKDFAALANTNGITHETLKKRYTEIIQSRNSF
jgi:hypothetical protein